MKNMNLQELSWLKTADELDTEVFFLALAEYFGDIARQGKIYNDLTSGYLIALSDLIMVNIYDGSHRKNKYKHLIYELDSILDNGQEYKGIRNNAIHYALSVSHEMKY